MSLEQLRAAFKQTSTVEIEEPELGKIRLSKIPAREGMRLADLAGAKEQTTPDDALALNIEAIALSVVDESGQRYLNTNEGRQFIGEWSLVALQNVASEVLKLNGLAAKN